MAVETRAFDPAAYLTTPEGIEEYLTAAFETHDSAFIADALGVVARAQNMSKLSRDTGLTRQTLYQALSPTGNPEFGTIVKVTQALGFELVPKRVVAA